MVRRSAIAFVFVVLFAHAASAADHPSFRVQVSGTGRPMILIPGLASSGETWDTTVARYRTRFTCHVLSVAGFAGVPPIDGPLLPAVRRGLAEVYGADLREDIARITSPTLVLGTWRGVHDQLLANKIDVPKADFLKEFAAQYAKLPRLHFALHDTGRHFIMWDDPMWFFDELDAFFADPAARVRSRGF